MSKLSLAAIVLGGIAATAQAQTKWDIASAYPTSNFHTENLTQFAKDVEQAAGGKLRVTVHANAALFKAPDIKRAVQGNQAQVGEILLVNYQNEWQGYGVDGLPFLADSYPEARKLYQAQKPALEKKLGEQGIMLLYAVPWPPQGLFVKKPISSLADLKGSKWRAYSPATTRMAELIGAQPVTVQAADLPQAMATGAVESFMTSGATGYDSKTYEHIKYYYNTQAWLPKNAVIVNRKAFESLDEATQQAVRKAAAAAEERGWKTSEAKDREYVGLLKKNGMEIVEPSPQLKTDMRKMVGEPILKEWLQKAGPEGQAVVDAYKKP
ncbi:TRAP transporter substrate-binding protein [Eleftheria terrae]|uniref:TRAP transporter substrate-binding protein n=1 Tax=Eleftheria terrae TaxID=1597781 RepID=UPI00263A68E7|nr:TRAP transporter substrate-binding protein [Eleftheria terrae]WKB51109.1 TRAP transporter substrate-binding protein [Eleftheria terrae]